jgi:hypothetical protein
MKSDKTYIAVLDYRDGTIKMYTVLNKELEEWKEDDMLTEGVENWLVENTDYSTSNCYFMFSKEPIKILKMKAK